MEFDKVKSTIIKLLENNGIIIESSEEDLDLRNYSIDSILFISFIVDVENEFAITIPDEYLTIDLLQSIDGLTNLIIELKTLDVEQHGIPNK
ncbi:MAG: acyl carrier protein [Clostridia bacterium]|nr:acyl carrier protein [Clostridia bacterium]